MQSLLAIQLTSYNVKEKQMAAVEYYKPFWLHCMDTLKGRPISEIPCDSCGMLGTFQENKATEKARRKNNLERI